MTGYDRMKTLNSQMNNVRGLGLLPMSWIEDFPHLPQSMFATKPLLRILDCRSESRGRFAFEGLLKIGRQVRSRLDNPASDPGVIEACKRFSTWLAKDADIIHKIHAYLAFIKRNQCSQQSDFTRVARSMDYRIRALGNIHVNHDVTLIGFAACGHKLAIIATRSSGVDPIHNLALLDFSMPDQDLTNAAIIALALIFARHECLNDAQDDIEQSLARRLEQINMEDSDEDA